MTTIFALITAVSKSGVSVVRISGPKARECLRVLGFRKFIAANEIKFGRIYDVSGVDNLEVDNLAVDNLENAQILNSQILDECVIAYFEAPNSFTGQDVVEISVHSSTYIIKKLLQILAQIDGVRMAQPGEFSKIAFLNNKLDLVQAEAIPDLIAAETEAQHKQALRQLQGELGKIYEDWRGEIIEICALTESCIDFPDEDLPQEISQELASRINNLKQEIALHLDDKYRGQKIKEGLSLAIIGSPNVGKSSLLNFLAKSEVAIVSDIAGTTRDIIEIHLEIAGIAVKIADTAGLRESVDLIEQEGIKRALAKAKNADLKILMIDAQNPQIDLQFQEEQKNGQAKWRQDLVDDETIIVINKIDLQKSDGLLKQYPQAVAVSLKENINTKLLLQKLEERVLEIVPNHCAPMITQERYRQSLQEALYYLQNFSLGKNIELGAEDLRLAAFAIAKITGRIDVDNILDVIFSKFCIGK